MVEVIGTIGPVLVRAGLFCAITIMVGAATFRLVVLPRAGLRETHAAFHDHAGQLAAMAGLASAIALVPVVGLILLVQALEFRDPFDAMGPQVQLLLTGTLWGRMWQVQIALVVSSLIAYAACKADGRVSRWWVAGILSAAVAMTPAMSGHSMAGGRFAVVADGLHVLAAGVWLGGLAVLVTAFLRRPPDSGDDGVLLSSLITSFSPVALGAATVVGLTGLFGAWLHVGDLTFLWTTAYGGTLSAKLGLVGAVALCGAYNWKRMRPQLAEAGMPDRFVRGPARLELAFGLLVILITSLLIAMPLPLEG